MNIDSASSNLLPDRPDRSTNPPPSCVADQLGLGTLADDDSAMDVELLKNLYRHARGQDGQRHLFEHDPTFHKRWVNLDSQAATAIITTFVPLDDAEDLKHARRIAQNNLEAQAWNDLLGIESPPIKCRVKIHGNKWGLRFQSAESKLRGQELVNEELPAIPGDSPSDPVLAPSNSPSPASVACDKTSPPITPATTAEDVLRKGGMPA